MTTKNRIFLTAAVIAFAIGMSDLAENIFFYMGRPVGAILFIVFMISQFLQKEVALYDKEQDAKLESGQSPTPARVAPANSTPRREQELVAHSAA